MNALNSTTALTSVDNTSTQDDATMTTTVDTAETAAPTLAKPVAKSTLRQVAVSKIKFREGYNVRHFDADKDKEDAALLTSIRTQGLRTPPTVEATEDGNYFVLAGHRRMSAVKALLAEDPKNVAFRNVWVLVEGSELTEVQRTTDLLTSNQQKNLTGKEKLEVVTRLRALGLTTAQMAQEMGVSTRHVLNHISVIDGPAYIKQMVDAGKLTSTLAIEVMQDCGDLDYAETIIRKAIHAAQVKGKAKITALDIALIDPNAHADSAKRLLGYSEKKELEQIAKKLAKAEADAKARAEADAAKAQQTEQDKAAAAIEATMADGEGKSGTPRHQVGNGSKPVALDIRKAIVLAWLDRIAECKSLVDAKKLATEFKSVVRDAE